jgi:plasmid maintenance system antidote protein VapI
LVKALGDDTQATVAKRLGCSVPYLNNLIHGRKLPSRGMASTLKREVGIPVEAWDQDSI